MCTDNWLIPDNKFLNASCMTFSFRPSGSGCWKASHWCETKMASPLSRVYSTSKPCSNDTSWLLTSWMARKLSSGIVNMGKSSEVAHSCCFSGARTASAKRSKAVARPLLLQLLHRIMASGDSATGNRKSWRSALNARLRFLCRYMSHVFQFLMCHMCATGAMHSHICIHMSCAPLWFLGYIFIPYLHSTSLICIFQDMHVSLMLTSMFQDMHVSGCFYIILSSFRPFNMLHRSTAKDFKAAQLWDAAAQLWDTDSCACDHGIDVDVALANECCQLLPHPCQWNDTHSFQSADKAKPQNSLCVVGINICEMAEVWRDTMKFEWSHFRKRMLGHDSMWLPWHLVHGPEIPRMSPLPAVSRNRTVPGVQDSSKVFFTLTIYCCKHLILEKCQFVSTQATKKHQKSTSVPQQTTPPSFRLAAKPGDQSIAA